MKLWNRRKKVGGWIEFYGLQDWWFSTFSAKERRHIDERFRPMNSSFHALTQGTVASSQPVTEFLNDLASWFRTKQDASIAERIYSKMQEIGREHPVTGPGYYNGRHFTTYVREVKELKKKGDWEKAENLLLELVAATEADNAATGMGVAPWYYEELAKIYRRRRQYDKEVKILERFAAQRHAPGVTPPKLLTRLERARQLLAKERQSTQQKSNR